MLLIIPCLVFSKLAFAIPGTSEAIDMLVTMSYIFPILGGAVLIFKIIKLKKASAIIYFFSIIGLLLATFFILVGTFEHTAARLFLIVNCLIILFTFLVDGYINKRKYPSKIFISSIIGFFLYLPISYLVFKDIFEIIVIIIMLVVFILLIMVKEEFKKNLIIQKI